MQFANFYDKLFAYPTAIKVLRFLSLYNPEMTGRELARFCGISHIQLYRLMEVFESQGIIIRNKAGKSIIFKLNKSNALAQILNQLFEKEKTFLTDILTGTFSTIKNDILSLIIFGSVAGNNERPDSDVDIFILVRGQSKKQLVDKILPNIEIEFYEKTGNRLSPVLLTLEEFKYRASTNKTIFANIFDGKLIFGAPLKEFLNDRQPAKKASR